MTGQTAPERIVWNDNMYAAPKDGSYVLVRLPHIRNPRGILACFHDGKWRMKPNGSHFEPPPNGWRWRPQGDTL